MHAPVSRTLRLSGGTVTLRAWGSHVVEAHTLDLLTLTATLGAMREAWAEFEHDDVEPGVWAAFWRLVQASLDGTELPRPLTWGDRLELISTLWELNDLEGTEGKLLALSRRAQTALLRIQGRTTPPTS